MGYIRLKDYSCGWTNLVIYFCTSPVCDVAQTSDGGILVFTFIVSPVCDVAQTSDGGILVFTFIVSPVCDVAQPSDCGISFKALYVMSLRRPIVAFLFKPCL